MNRFARPCLGALLAVGTISCGGGGGGDASPASPNQPSGSTVSIAIVGQNGSQSFTPNPAGVRVGQAVTWRNADGVVHRIVEDGRSEPGGGDIYGSEPGAATSDFDTGDVNPGATSQELTARAAGTIRYHCSIHPTMVGTLTINP